MDCPSKKSRAPLPATWLRPGRAQSGKWILPAALLLSVPAKIFACAACYGANIDAPMADGMNWAIFTLGAIMTPVLGAFLVGLIYLVRRSEAVEAARKKALEAQVNA